MAEAKLLGELTSSLETHARAATFACGGSVSFRDLAAQSVDQEHGQEPTDLNTPPTASDTHPTTIADIQIRFGESGEGITVIFNHEGASPKALQQLIQACLPASLGRGGEAILDEAYRKAGKLDRSKFATSFCPYEAGIVDVVSQLLVPQYKHDKHTHSLKVATLHLIRTHHLANDSRLSCTS